MYWLTEEDFRAMRVRFAFPAATAQGTQVPAFGGAVVPVAAGGGAAVEAGREDRLFYRRWLAGLTERGRDGAAFAMKPSRLPSWANCWSASWAFSNACYTAQGFLAKADERSRDPGCRLGWEGP